MSGRASAARYARALLDVAIAEADPVQAGADLGTFGELVAGNAPLREALTSPAVPAAGKERLVNALVARLGLKPPVSKLLLMLAGRDRMALLPDLIDVYRERLMEHQQVVHAEIATALPLSEAQVTALQARLSRATGQQVTMRATVDPALIGGMTARIGSTVYDGSLATQLEKMRARLLQES